MTKKSSKKVQWKYAKLNGVMNRQFKVSNEGEIFNVKKGVLVNKSDMQKKSPFNGSDYQKVSLNGEAFRLHRVVCETFHGPAPAGKNIVLHLDEVKDNNDKTNLKWGTLSENSQAYIASHNGKRPAHSDKKISRAKTLINKGYTNDKVARMTKICDSHISLIKLGRSRTAIEPLTKQQIELGNV